MKTESVLQKIENQILRPFGLFDSQATTQPPRGLVDAILVDHEALKKLIHVLKDHEATNAQKRVAHARFRELLVSHARAEEKALYTLSSRMRGLELKTEEGQIEHDVADMFMPKIQPPKATAASRLRWRAQLQVLGELTEHHLEEEERDLLPKVAEKIEPEEDARLVALYLLLRAKTQRKAPRKYRGALVQ